MHCLDRPADVLAGGNDAVPADGVEQDELVASVESHVLPYVQLERNATVARYAGPPCVAAPDAP
jgi:hypothetical protein